MKPWTLFWLGGVFGAVGVATLWEPAFGVGYGAALIVAGVAELMQKDLEGGA